MFTLSTLRGVSTTPVQRTHRVICLVKVRHTELPNSHGFQSIRYKSNVFQQVQGRFKQVWQRFTDADGPSSKERNLTTSAAATATIRTVKDTPTPIVGTHPPYGITNPFSYATPVTPYEAIKLIFGTLILVPIRVTLLIPTITVMIMFAKIAVIGVKPEELAKPVAPWRHKLLIPSRFMVRTALFICGYHWVKISGKPAKRTEAPILVSNHVSFVDPLFFFYHSFPSFVAKKSLSRIPFIGKVFAVICFLVERTDAASKQDTVAAIKRRAELSFSGESYKDRKYRQIMVYPEGTTTNGKALIAFKAGAFAPGYPIQPVCVLYPHKHFNPCWTAGGPGIGMLFWRLLCQFHVPMEIKYLDVVVPTEAEKHNPLLFAKNVRAKMAAALNVPTTDHSYEDVLLMTQAIQAKLPPHSTAVLELSTVRNLYNVDLEQAKQLLQRFSAIDRSRDGTLDYEEFCKWLNLSCSEETLKLFQLFDIGNTGSIDFKEFVISVSRLSRNMQTANLVELIFRALDTNYDGKITSLDMKQLLAEKFAAEEVETLFKKIDSDNDGLVNYDEFLAFSYSHPQYMQLVDFVISRKQPELSILGNEHFE